MSTYNDFELLLFAAAEKSCERQAQEFLSVDSTGFEISPSQQKRMKKIAKTYGFGIKKKPSYIRLIAAACLIALAISLSACMYVPKIRNAIKAFFVEWYENYIAIGFGEKENNEPKYEFIEPNKDTEESEAVDPKDTVYQNSSEETQPLPPSKITKKISLTYLPEAYNMKVDIDNETYYSIMFFEEEEIVFTAVQNIINSELNWTNSEQQNIYKTTVNSYDAILIEDLQNPNVYTIIWQDNEYEYLIAGKFSDIKEITKVAEGIILQ